MRRSRLVLFVFVLFLIGTVQLPDAIRGVLPVGATDSIPSAVVDTTHPGYGLDCNGLSPLYPNAPFATICVDPSSNANSWNGRFYDNGYYIGHDEPSVQFFSDVPGSGYNLEWAITLPPADPAPNQNGSVVATFELYRTIWFSLALCDPWSYPQNACTPESDSNIGGPWPASQSAA